MTIAITGGTGFIGSNIASLLEANSKPYKLLDLQNKNDHPQFVHADVTSAEDMFNALKGASAIMHLAAEHRDDVFPRQKYYDVNVGGAERIVEAAEAHNIKTIIFTSTVAVYGLNSGESQEDSTPDPFNDYGKSKLESEIVFQKWAEKEPDRKLVIIRLVATFGKGNRGNIFTLMDQIYRKRFVMVGAGQNRKSIAYVGNVAAFLVHMLDNAPNGACTYNYADKPDLTTRDLVLDIRKNFGMDGIGPCIPYIAGITGGAVFDVLARITGKTFPVSVVRVQKFCANTVVSSEKKAETGFKPPYSLQDGLNEMIAAEFPAPQEAKEETKAAA